MKRSAYFVVFSSALIIIMLMEGETLGGRKRHEPGPTSVSVGQSYRIYPSGVTQTEPLIVRHPSNSNILFASANTINFSTGFISEGVYVTTNGGQLWYGSDTCNGSPITFHHGDPGIAIDKDGRFHLVRLGPEFSPGIYAHFSANNGTAWSSQRTLQQEFVDRGTVTSDVDMSSSFFGRTYAAWIWLNQPYPVVCVFTTDGGQTWTAPAQVNNPAPRSLGAEITTGPNGTVNICWARVISISPFTEDFVGFASSTNGGASWTVLENAFDMNGIAGTFPSKGNIRVNGLPRIDTDKTGGPRNGWIYIATAQRNLSPAGSDPDIILNRSTNGGVTWSSGIRVNQDAVSNSKFQYFPAIHVDDSGGVNVLYYDDRNTTSDSSGVYLSRSTDGGNTWNDYQISDHHFRPQPIGGLGQGYQGDNIGLTSVGDTLWPVWMDNSSGIYQIWTCPVDISSLGTFVDELAAPGTFILRQNYPNPFNPSTSIQYELLRNDVVTLEVFDMKGSRVAKLVSGKQNVGQHTARFSGEGLASGIYIYRLVGAGFSETRKMVLLR